MNVPMTNPTQDALAGIDLPEDLPQALVDLRIRLGLSQSALAKQLRVSLPTIRRWEAGEATPSSLPVRARLSNVLRLSKPVGQMQAQAMGMADTLDALRGLAGSPPSELVADLLAMLDDPGVVDQVEGFLRAQMRVGLDPFVAALAGAFDGSEFAGLPEAMQHRLESDVLRATAFLFVGSLRNTLLEARQRAPLGGTSQVDSQAAAGNQAKLHHEETQR